MKIFQYLAVVLGLCVASKSAWSQSRISTPSMPTKPATPAYDYPIKKQYVANPTAKYQTRWPSTFKDNRATSEKTRQKRRQQRRSIRNTDIDDAIDAVVP